MYYITGNSWVNFCNWRNSMYLTSFVKFFMVTELVLFVLVRVSDCECSTCMSFTCMKNWDTYSYSCQCKCSLSVWLCDCEMLLAGNCQRSVPVLKSELRRRRESYQIWHHKSTTWLRLMLLRHWQSTQPNRRLTLLVNCFNLSYLPSCLESMSVS